MSDDFPTNEEINEIPVDPGLPFNALFDNQPYTEEEKYEVHRVMHPELYGDGGDGGDEGTPADGFVAYIAETTEGHAIMLSERQMREKPDPDARFNMAEDDWEQTVPRKPGEFAAGVQINLLGWNRELSHLINTYCWDSALEMPDHILACQMTDILLALRQAHNNNVQWHNGDIQTKEDV